MTKKLKGKELTEFTQWKLKRIKKNPLERKPGTAREVQTFREETKKK